ncbi:MAG TPA: hypothetical protein VK607_25365 [Kofleriaceae bacterium]|nr:hypothetical protein [Kofleriaceae bacterium]
MTEHDDSHGERLLQVAFDGASPSSEILASLARCDDCLTQLARALEDAIVLGPANGTRAARLGAILEEALVWRAVLEDAARLEDAAGSEPVQAEVEITGSGKQKAE